MGKTLITGGLGHIGSFITSAWSSDITVVDDLTTQRYCSLFHKFDAPMKFIEEDFCKVDVGPYDTVIHLAAITDAAGSFDKKQEVENVNYLKTVELIDKCKDKRFIFPSSTSVYGTADEVMYEYSQTNPQSPYAETKLKVEEHLSQVHPNHLIMRFGTICGVSMGMRFHTAVNKFCYESSIGRPLTVWKENYEMKRPYLALIDANQFIIHAEKEKLTGIYNVVTDNIILKDIVEYIMRKKAVNIKYVNTPLLNQHSYEVSTERSRATGFEYHGDIYSCIDSTLSMLGGIR